MINRPTGLSSQLAPLSLDSSPATPPSSTTTHLNTGRLKFPDEPEDFPFTAVDLEDLGEIGRGNYGTVSKMRHKQTGREIAVKRIRSNTVNKNEQRRLILELETVLNAQPCEYIIKFFGAIFYEGDCWICMELMDVSLDKLYKKAFDCKIPITEQFVGHITVCTVRALNFLKDELNIIHRDVKPSNIVLNRDGEVKLVDFGIAGQLVDSIAKTQDVGCKPYMAPERVTDMAGQSTYDVRSDVWSLGITLVEISTGKFPYGEWTSPFDQLTEVVEGPAPILTLDKLPDEFTAAMVTFVNQCLSKEKHHRPKYHELMQMPFFIRYDQVISHPDTRATIGAYVASVLDQ